MSANARLSVAGRLDGSRTAPRAPARLAGATSLALIAIICLACTALSTGLQGFSFGTWNNAFHIPVAENWLDDPHFASDAFVQSLRYFTSYVWPVARVLTGWIGTENAFFVLQAVNRAAMFGGMALLLWDMGVRSAAGQGLALLTLAVTRMLLVQANPGHHDLFMPYLNHSSVTWPFMFVSYALLIRRRMTGAVAITGITFGVNAFVAIGHAPALLAASLAYPHRTGAERRRLLMQWLVGGGLAAVLAAPTLVWIGQSFVAQPAPTPFSFVSFLITYWPDHWFISTTSFRQLVSFALLCAMGGCALALLGERCRPLLYALGGYLALFAVSVVLPYVTDSRAILDLHPLRVSAGCMVMLSVIAVTAFLVLRIESGETAAERFAAALALVAFCFARDALIVTVLIVFAAAFLAMPAGFEGVRRRMRAVADAASELLPPRPAAALAACLAGVLLIGAGRAVLEPLPYDREELTSVRDAGLWLRDNTPPDSVIWAPEAAERGVDIPVQSWARRTIWYDHKSGAAVMWSPQFHDQWEQRRRDILALRSPSDFLTYSCRSGVSFLLVTRTRLADFRAAAVTSAVFENARYAVLDIRAYCSRGRRE